MKAILLIFLMVFFAGCATVTPNELLSARAAYQHAIAGPALELAPAELHKARLALDEAEQSFKNDSDSYKTLDLAYVAQRKSELANVLGKMAADENRKDKSEAAYDAEQNEIIAKGKEDLRDSEKRAANAESDADAAKARSDADAANARANADAAKARADADAKSAKRDLKESEKRTADALAALAKLAAVKEDERGLVVTLSGSVLFKSNESRLLSAAKTKLNQVGEALRAVSERNIIVEGHTDSRGTASYNQGLSQRRADTVRDYLVRGGYPSDRIRSEGMGQGSPIADNASAEGRANNRRVEIIIERQSHASNQ